MTSKFDDRPPSMFTTALAGLLAMAAAMGFGRFSFTPILPGMIGDFGLTASQSGLIASANFLGYLFAAVLAGYGWAQGRERQVALSALGANALLLAAMAAGNTVLFFCMVRFFAGLASAFAMIFTSSVVLGHAAKARNAHVSAAHFGGPGVGIALSSAMVMILGLALQGSHGAWRAEWIGGALLSAVALAFVIWLLPSPVTGGASGPEPRIAWTKPMMLTTLSYGIFGFGYVITATFLVTIARQSASGRWAEFLCWLVVGLSAAVALFLWRPMAERLGLGRIYVVAILVEIVGVLFTVLLPPAIAPILGGLLFGATFLAITAYGLQIGRQLSPQSPRRAFAVMTAAFGMGQIVGPVIAGFAAEWTGSFTLATYLAALALTFSALLILPVIRNLA